MDLSLRANNVFYYYRHLEQATQFYVELLGFPLVADYGYARVVQAAPSSFLTLVDVRHGTHAGDEPKSVTTAFITDELEAWYVYLAGQRVPMRHPYAPQPDAAHEGFVALDPEGYFLEFERFNPHPENSRLLPLLATLPSRYPAHAPAGGCPTVLGTKATVTWLYYQEPAQARRFLTEALGLACAADQGFAAIYRSSQSGFLGPVQAGEGLHPFAPKKLVTLSLITDDVEAWFAHMHARPDFTLHAEQPTLEGGQVTLFVGYDPEDYCVEFDTVRHTSANAALLSRLAQIEKFYVNS